MSDETSGWSTPKFLLILLPTAFVVAFLVNLVFNEWLGLGLGSASIGAAIGVVSALLATRWSVFQKKMQKRNSA